MKLNDNITELYYRIGFGMCGTLARGYAIKPQSWSVWFAKTGQMEVWCLEPQEKHCKDATLPAHSKANSSMRIERGSLRWLNKAIFGIIRVSDIITRTGIRACRYISDALNNYPKILQFKFLSNLACMISIVLGGLLEMVAVKTILLTKTHKILSNGLPFHLRPMVT